LAKKKEEQAWGKIQFQDPNIHLPKRSGKRGGDITKKVRFSHRPPSKEKREKRNRVGISSSSLPEGGRKKARRRGRRKQ